MEKTFILIVLSFCTLVVISLSIYFIKQYKRMKDNYFVFLSALYFFATLVILATLLNTWLVW